MVYLNQGDYMGTFREEITAEAKDVLLGALPLEGMDLIVDPVRRRLAGAHGDQPLHVLYTIIWRIAETNAKNVP
jgi:hypothetical protein